MSQQGKRKTILMNTKQGSFGISDHIEKVVKGVICGYPRSLYEVDAFKNDGTLKVACFLPRESLELTALNGALMEFVGDLLADQHITETECQRLANPINFTWEQPTTNSKGETIQVKEYLSNCAKFSITLKPGKYEIYTKSNGKAISLNKEDLRVMLSNAAYATVSLVVRPLYYKFRGTVGIKLNCTKVFIKNLVEYKASLDSVDINDLMDDDDEDFNIDTMRNAPQVGASQENSNSNNNESSFNSIGFPASTTSAGFTSQGFTWGQTNNGAALKGNSFNSSFSGNFKAPNGQGNSFTQSGNGFAAQQGQGFSQPMGTQNSSKFSPNGGFNAFTQNGNSFAKPEEASLLTPTNPPAVADEQVEDNKSDVDRILDEIGL